MTFFPLPLYASQNGEVALRSIVTKLLTVVSMSAEVLLGAAVFQNYTVSGEGKTRTFTDMMGRKVVVPEPLTRVALLGGPTG